MVSRRALFFFLVGSVACAFASASNKKMPPGITRLPAITAGSTAPAADPDLTTYYVGLITKGPKFDTYSKEDVARIQTMHLRNLERLADLGKLMVAGPFSDNADRLGLFIFKCATLAEAKELAASDPAVVTGRFAMEVHPWVTEKGAIRDAEFAPHPAK